MDFCTLYLNELNKNRQLCQELSYQREEHMRVEFKLREEIGVRDNKVNELNHKIAEARRSHDDVCKNFMKIESILKVVYEDLANEKRKVDEKQQEIESLKRQINELNTLVKSSNDQIEKLKEDFRKSNQEVFDTRDLLREKEHQVSDSQVRISQMEKDLCETRKELQRREEQTQKELKKTREEISSLSKKSLNDKSKIEMLETKLTQALHDLVNTKEESNQYKQIIDKMKSFNEKADLSIKRLQGELFKFKLVTQRFQQPGFARQRCQSFMCLNNPIQNNYCCDTNNNTNFAEVSVFWPRPCQ